MFNLSAQSLPKTYILAAVIVCGSIAFFIWNKFTVHSTVGQWEDSSCKMKLSVFKDNTAIYHYAGLGNEACEWSEKDSRLIVLMCSISRQHDQTLTFKSISGDTGFLDGIYRGLSEDGFDMHRATPNDVCSKVQ